MTPSSRVFSLTVLTAIFAYLLTALMATEAYSTPTKTSATRITSTSLNAWTLPNKNSNPTSRNPFGKFSATWYDDHNPTARKVVYNDDDQAEPFRFVMAFGDDWASVTEFKEADDASEKAEPRRPLRLVATWTINRLRRFSSSS